MGGGTIYSDKKLQFYPTHSLETLRTLGVLSGFGDIKEGLHKEFEEKYESIIREDYYKIDIKQTYSKYRLNYLIENTKLLYKYGYFNLNNLVISDLFCA